MKLSIIIPVFNEEKTLHEVIKTVQEVNVNKEIILVDDASSDSSPQILKELSKQPGIKTLFHEKNMSVLFSI